MKILTNDDGRPTFLPEEYRTAQQISSLFSRLTSTQRQRFADAEEISEEDIEAVKAEMVLKDLRSLAIDDVEKTSHPIIVRGYNICELLKSNELASLLFLSAQPINCAEPRTQHLSRCFRDRSLPANSTVRRTCLVRARKFQCKWCPQN